MNDTLKAEPTDAFTAVDMATAASQGFRDGQAAVEPAPAQDERNPTPDDYLAARSVIESCDWSNVSIGTKEILGHAVDLLWLAAQACPAQTEQQPRHYDELKAARDLIRDFRRAVNTSDVATRTAAARAALCSCRDRADEILSAPIAQTALQMDGWISVEDRLPEVRDGTRYLVARDCGNGTLKSTSVGFLLGDEWYMSDDVRSFRDMGYRVTHWMPLPAAPQGGE